MTKMIIEGEDLDPKISGDVGIELIEKTKSFSLQEGRSLKIGVTIDEEREKNIG